MCIYAGELPATVLPALQAIHQLLNTKSSPLIQAVPDCDCQSPSMLGEYSDGSLSPLFSSLDTHYQPPAETNLDKICLMWYEWT